MAEMATARTRIVVMRDDQFDLAKEIARYVRDQCSERLSVATGRPGPIETFSLRRSKERIDELLEVYDADARERARQTVGNGGKNGATERWPGDSGTIPPVGDRPPAAQDEGAKDAASPVSHAAGGDVGPEKGGMSEPHNGAR